MENNLARTLRFLWLMSVLVWTEEWIMLSHSAGRFEPCLVSDISCPEISYDKSPQGSPAESRAVGIDVLLKPCNLEVFLKRHRSTSKW